MANPTTNHPFIKHGFCKPILWVDLEFKSNKVGPMTDLSTNKRWIGYDDYNGHTNLGFSFLCFLYFPILVKQPLSPIVSRKSSWNSRRSDSPALELDYPAIGQP